MSNTSHDVLVASTSSVLLVDDHAIWRGGVRSMLEGTEFVVIGEASSGREALTVAPTLNAQIILLDIRMAGGDGLEVLHELKQANPLSAVVMLTTYDNPAYVARAVAGGASGFLLKGVDREELLQTLRLVANGEMLLKAEDLVRSIRSLSGDTIASLDLIEPLTEREVEVLRLVALGMSNKDVGSVLFVAESTIKTHVMHIINKLGVSDRVQAAVWAAQHGLLAEANHPGLPG